MENIDSAIETICNLPIKDMLFLYLLFLGFTHSKFDKYIKLNNQFEKSAMFVAMFAILRILIIINVL